MVNVIFKWSAFHWESPEIEALSASIDALYTSKAWKYLGITGEENILVRSVDIERITKVSEEARKTEVRPPKGITVLDIGEMRTIGYGREYLEYKVRFSCDINETFYNIVFYIGQIIAPNIKSLESVVIELIQKIPAGMSVEEAEKRPDYSKLRQVLA